MNATAPKLGFLSLHDQNSSKRSLSATAPSYSTEQQQHQAQSPRQRRLTAKHAQRQERRQTIKISRHEKLIDSDLKSSQLDPTDRRSDLSILPSSSLSNNVSSSTFNSRNNSSASSASSATCVTSTNDASSLSTAAAQHELNELFGHTNNHPLSKHFSQHTQDMLSQVRLRRQSRRDGVVQWEPRRLGVNYSHIVDKYRSRREEIRDETREKKDVSKKIKHSFDQHRWLVQHGHKAQQQKKQAHLKRLRQWWEFLDADGGGTLSVDELEDPLVSVGLARGRADVEKLIEIHDTSGEGELSFENFTSMLTSRDSINAVIPEVITETTQQTSATGLLNKETEDSKHSKQQQTKETIKLPASMTKKKKRKKKDKKNAVMQLFDDLEDGKFGNKDVGLPLQITTYRRQMLLNVHLSPDPIARAKGLMVLNGIIDTKRSQRKDLEEAAAEVDLRDGLDN